MKKVKKLDIKYKSLYLIPQNTISIAVKVHCHCTCYPHALCLFSQGGYYVKNS